MSAPVAIRAARMSDADRLAALISQMGHSVTREGVEERMPQVLADALTEIVVAEGDGGVVGCAVLAFRTVLHRPGLSATLALLVVDEAHRSRGIGARLVEWVENHARERGAKRLTLTSGSTVRTRTASTGAWASRPRACGSRANWTDPLRAARIWLGTRQA